MLYGFGRRVLSPFLRRIYHLNVVGEENIPACGKVILCSNHCSLLDPCFLGISVRKRQIFYMAKSELFECHGKWVGGLLRRLGAFPVRRDCGDAASMRTALSLLHEGNILGIFPQGKCVFDHSPFQPKAGVAMLAAKSGADVLPACVYCDGLVKPFVRVTVRFGPLIPFASLGLEQASKTAVKQAAHQIAEQVNRLLEERH